MLEKKDVIEYLWGIKNKNEIHEFWDILKRRNRQLEEQLTVNFQIGDNVRFRNKKGNVIGGIITQINRKSINVEVNGGVSWKVSPSLLEKC